MSSLLTLPVDESNEATPTSLVEIIEDSLRECYHEKYSIDNCEMDVDVPLWKQLQRMTLIDMTSSSSVKSNQDANEDNFQRKVSAQFIVRECSSLSSTYLQFFICADNSNRFAAIDYCRRFEELLSKFRRIRKAVSYNLRILNR